MILQDLILAVSCIALIVLNIFAGGFRDVLKEAIKKASLGGHTTSKIDTPSKRSQ